ncbi:MAG: ferritin-like fold-containing protein, partial [Actinomycetota bacterium]
YRARTHGANWLETVTTCYVTAGLLDDFSRRLASGLASDAAARIEAIYSEPDGAELLVELLRTAIDADTRVASKLAMWGRRLVGDTLLIARSALALPPSTASEEARLEPVFTEIIAAHTRRMDALGLTA